jgi:2-polyprenyl-3-methyl-5-hydroxy-6-metoxy-1,4-benzoquinol methylase
VSDVPNKEQILGFFRGLEAMKDKNLAPAGAYGTPNVARAVYVARYRRAVMNYVEELLYAGEPIKALEVLQNPPALLAHDKYIIETQKKLAAQLAHAFSFEAFTKLYSGFHTTAPGGKPLTDANLLNMDRYYHLAVCLSNVKNTSVLNVGAGDGIIDLAMLHVAQDIQRWCIADFEPNCSAVVEALKEHTIGKEITGHPVAEHLFDWPSGPFDVVIASEVIEHVPDQTALLKAAHTRLNPGGHIILTTPDAAFWVATPTEYYHHLTASTSRGLSDAVEQAGFVVKYCEVSQEQHTVILGQKK